MHRASELRLRALTSALTLACALVTCGARASDRFGSVLDRRDVDAREEPSNEERFHETASGRVDGVRTGAVHVASWIHARIGQGVRFDEMEQLGRVAGVDEGGAIVELPLHARVPHGATGSLVRKRGAGLDLSPPRLGGIFSFDAEAHVFAGFNLASNGGVQTMSTVSAEYHDERAFALRATLAHAALAFTSPTNIAAIEGWAGASLDTRLFEVGLAAGATSINDDTYPHAAAAFALVPLLRIGAIDGLSFLATMAAVTVQDRLEFGEIDAVVTVPLTRHVWMLVRGGGGRSGYFHGDFAGRVLVRGNGDHGSIFLVVSTGVAATFFRPIPDSYLFGPGGGVGVEYRP